MKKFIKGLFLDDVGEPCIGRFSLFLGIVLTVITGVWSIDTVGDVTLWEAVVRCSPGLIGLIAYSRRCGQKAMAKKMPSINDQNPLL